jgi:hypothetical protein
VLGLQVRNEVRGLTQLSDTLRIAGTTLDGASRQLDTLGDLPFVGNRIRDAGRELRGAAASVNESARTSRQHIETLSSLLAFAVAVAPTIPLVALYVPLRLRRVREVRAVRTAMNRSADDRVFSEFLARRATERLPYHALLRVSANPWDDLNKGRFRALADAELDRLGMARRPRGPRRASMPSHD